MSAPAKQTAVVDGGLSAGQRMGGCKLTDLLDPDHYWSDAYRTVQLVIGGDRAPDTAQVRLVAQSLKAAFERGWLAHVEYSARQRHAVRQSAS